MTTTRMLARWRDRPRVKKEVDLSKLELFRRCSANDLRLLASVADDITFRPGEAVCREGQHAYECFVIASGKVEVRVHAQPVAVLGQGDVVGEIALLDGGRRSASVSALTDVNAFVIDRRHFEHLLETAPAIARAMLTQLSRRLRSANEALVAANDTRAVAEER